MRTITLRRQRFDRMTDARAAFGKTACVYVQADARGRPVRVGKASLGLHARYRGGTGWALDAASHASRNFVFVAAVPRALVAAVEAALIFKHRAALPYNNQGKRRAPSGRVRLRHLGAAPLW